MSAHELGAVPLGPNVFDHDLFIDQRPRSGTAVHLWQRSRLNVADVVLDVVVGAHRRGKRGPACFAVTGADDRKIGVLKRIAVVRLDLGAMVSQVMTAATQQRSDTERAETQRLSVR